MTNAEHDKLLAAYGPADTARLLEVLPLSKPTETQENPEKPTETQNNPSEPTETQKTEVKDEVKVKDEVNTTPQSPPKGGKKSAAL